MQSLLRPLVTILILFGFASSKKGTQNYHKDVVDRLAEQGLSNLAHYLREHPALGGCNLETAARRYEWGDLSNGERSEYIDAVLCLQSLPPRSDPGAVPGARSRFDDFVAVHIQMSGSIHATYWNWGRYASSPLDSPIFDGSATSLSGNGIFSPYPGLQLPLYPPPYNVIPPAEGGGCVTTGPFANMSVNLGPVFAGLPDVPANPQADGLGYNPRCLRRDVNVHAARETAVNYTERLIEDSPDVLTFQTVMNGRAELGEWGVHTAGHFTIGGDPGGDFFVAPGDPVFYLHHGMIDRVYWIWQMLGEGDEGLERRLRDVGGTITPGNSPPSRNGTADDVLDLGVLGESVRLGDALDTMGGIDGAFCYVYV
ncbi:hypothetical protein JX265_003352 [Neoarthrinium moseri]|uniref:Tyrosinase copper-binding domain-containing protein n=1 Tax=Neoarthrinium moseri TaxID=1658444 RepID=A0A9P9WS14_9PEZI|nr:hypothetical protein JX265_003352 [Neoarthrinium moseri]